MLKGSERNAEWTFVDLTWEAGLREYVVLPCVSCKTRSKHINTEFKYKIAPQSCHIYEQSPSRIEKRDHRVQNVFLRTWRTVGLDVHQLSPVRPWPSLSKRTLLWWTWTYGKTKSGLKGQRLGVWWGWCEGSESGPQDFIGMIKTQPFKKWSQWNAGRSWNECNSKWVFGDLKCCRSIIHNSVTSKMLVVFPIRLADIGLAWSSIS